MNREEFFAHYPLRKKDSNKYDNGVVLFLSGSYGMAGAALLNLIGARSVGASYIHSYVPHEVYPIVASKEITAVYHPYDGEDKDLVKELSLNKIDSVCFGSGINQLIHKKEYLNDLLEKCDVPLIIDADGLRLLAEDEVLYTKNQKLILTPHLGEFSALTHLSVKDIEKNKEEIAVNFAKEKNVILVLKGMNTMVISPEGEVYINDSGNESLARAGSGDVLSGMITGLCALYEDTYTAVKDSVWLHGYLADMNIRSHSVEVFDLESYPKLADLFFFEGR